LIVEDHDPYRFLCVLCSWKSLSLVHRTKECELIPLCCTVSTVFIAVSPGFVDLPTFIIAGSLVSCWHSLSPLLHPQQSLRGLQESQKAVCAYWKAAERREEKQKDASSTEEIVCVWGGVLCIAFSGRVDVHWSSNYLFEIVTM
jgi:predicted exporter